MSQWTVAGNVVGNAEWTRRITSQGNWTALVPAVTRELVSSTLGWGRGVNS